MDRTNDQLDWLVDAVLGSQKYKGSHLLVSFPVHSLGGRHKDMIANYESHFRELVANEDRLIRRFEFATELVFLVTKNVLFNRERPFLGYRTGPRGLMKSIALLSSE